MPRGRASRLQDRPVSSSVGGNPSSRASSAPGPVSRSPAAKAACAVELVRKVRRRAPDSEVPALEAAGEVGDRLEVVGPVLGGVGGEVEGKPVAVEDGRLAAVELDRGSPWREHLPDDVGRRLAAGEAPVKVDHQRDRPVPRRARDQVSECRIPADVVDPKDLARVHVPKPDQRPRGPAARSAGETSRSTSRVAAVLAAAVEHPCQRRALEQQGLDADGLEGVEHLDRRRVELRLKAEPADALDELVELGARTQARASARRSPDRPRGPPARAAG